MRTILAFLTGCLFLATGLAHAQSSPIKLDVKQVQKIDNEGKTGDTKTQTRTLDITLTNLGRDTLNVNVKYWFFSRDLKDNTENVFKKGTKPATLRTNTPVLVQSETVNNTYTEEHVEIEKAKGGKGMGKGGKNKSKAKKVEAQGDRITGYAVQVFIGNEMSTDFYSSPGLKQKLTNGK